MNTQMWEKRVKLDDTDILLDTLNNESGRLLARIFNNREREDEFLAALKENLSWTKDTAENIALIVEGTLREHAPSCSLLHKKALIEDVLKGLWYDTNEGWEEFLKEE